MKQCLVACVLLVSACDSTTYTHAAGGPYYFETFAADYKVPFTPKNEITQAQATTDEAAGNAYCIASFNEQGLVSTFEKRLKGKTFFRFVYTYKEGKLVEARGVNADGKESVQAY